MTDEQINLMALQLADKRMPEGSTNADLVKEAELLVKFIRAGIQIAT